MATIKYNGQEIGNAKITRFQTENEFEGDNFNRTGRKHTLEGVGVIGDASAWATSLSIVKDTLSTPAKKLEIDLGGGTGFVTYADGAGESTNYDARNGPLPQITITEIAGTAAKSALLIAFTFTWVECGSSIIQRAEIVTTHSLNEEGLLTISRRGFIRISAGGKGSKSQNEVGSSSAASITNPYPNILSTDVASIANAPATPDMYRRLVTGVCPAGFQRTKQDFYVQADQTTLAFDIEDVELAEILPYPVLNGDGSFEYTRDVDGNPQGTKTFRIELASNRDASLSDLFFRCIDIALTKIRLVGNPCDIVQSFKITQSSLFKRRVIGLEIVAYGTPGRSWLDPTQSVDAFLYLVIFDSPNPTVAGAYSDAYGSERSKSAANASPYLRYDPCILSSTWQSITGRAEGVLASYSQADVRESQALFADSEGNPIYKTPSEDTAPDEQMKEDLKQVISYTSSQSIDFATNCNFLVPMGFSLQYGFQFALPEVFITQRVEMITRSDSSPIPWPECSDGFVVVSQSIQINDAAPDATGNRMFAIHATRTIKVSVWNSGNTQVFQGGSNNFVAGNSMPRVVWMPERVSTGRNLVTGYNTITLMENRNGEVVRQDYVNDPSSDRNR